MQVQKSETHVKVVLPIDAECEVHWDILECPAMHKRSIRLVHDRHRQIQICEVELKENSTKFATDGGQERHLQVFLWRGKSCSNQISASGDASLRNIGCRRR